jgi:sulfoxide reductase heme-binding subunit YedZ
VDEQRRCARECGALAGECFRCGKLPRLPTAVDVSSVVGLVAVGILTANILLGLLISTGYNPLRRWPRRRIKLFTLHNWTGYTTLSVATLHPAIILLSPTAGFRPLDILVPISSPQQPVVNTLGAIALYLVAFAVITSYFRHVFGFHRWKLLHYVTYAAAVVFLAHGILSDPLLQNRPVDWIDAEKMYIEGCAALVTGATAWRITARRKRRRVGL